MTKKTIPFQIPKKGSDATPVPANANIFVPAETGADLWVQQEAPAEIALVQPAEPGRTQDAVASVTITISAQPDWFEAVKIAFLLPSLAVWFWTVGASQRNMRMFIR